MTQMNLDSEPIQNRFEEAVKFRTEPIPKNFWHSVPKRTEQWSLERQ